MYKWIHDYNRAPGRIIGGEEKDGLEGPAPFTNTPYMKNLPVWRTGIIIERYKNKYNVEFVVMMDERGIKEVVLFTNIKLIK